MCQCIEMAWCRTGEETQGGRFPMSNHHPQCEEYHAERYMSVGLGGVCCMMEPVEAEAMLRDADPEERYEVKNVWLTRDQFERMDEFTGY